MELKDALKQARMAKGYTQQYVADHLGVNQTAVGQWEIGTTHPQVKYLSPLADLLGCSVDYLLGRASSI